MLRVVVGFLPWIILAVLANRWFVPALLLALLASCIITAREIRRRSVKILDAVTFAFFLLVTIGILGFRWMALGLYMSLLVNLTLMAIAWGSLIIGVPFTIQYAREQVPPERWHAPLFIRINQYCTAVWGLDFTLAALIALYQHATGDRGFVVQYAWLFFLVCALLFTTYFPSWYRARALRSPGA